MNVRVAVYGTLRRGGSNHHFLENEKLEAQIITPVLQLYSLGQYPGAVWSESNGTIIEIYSLSETKLALLDQLEEFDPDSPADSEYLRESLDTSLGPCWVYIYNRSVDPSQLIASGDWIEVQSLYPKFYR